MGVDSERGKRRWYVAAVGGLAGLTGVAAVGVLTAGSAAAGPSKLAQQEAASTLQVTRPVADGSKDSDDQKMGDSEDHGKDGSEDGDAHEPGTQIRNNTAETGGGAIYNAGLLTVEDSRVSYNDAGMYGGGVQIDAGVANLTRVRVDHNNALSDSGGIDLEEGSTARVKDSWVTDNTSGNSSGGIGNYGGTLYLQRTKVRHNTSNNDGGGVGNIGGKTWSRTARSTRTPPATSVAASRTTQPRSCSAAPRSTGTGPSGRVRWRRNRQRRARYRHPDRHQGDRELRDERARWNLQRGQPDHVDDDSVIIKNRPTNCQGNPGSKSRTASADPRPARTTSNTGGQQHAGLIQAAPPGTELAARPPGRARRRRPLIEENVVPLRVHLRPAWDSSIR